jgi:hypothetical protein
MNKDGNNVTREPGMIDEMNCRRGGRGWGVRQIVVSRRVYLLRLLPEPVTLQGGGLHLALGTKFMMLSQKRILGHIEVETKKVY